MSWRDALSFLIGRPTVDGQRVLVIKALEVARALRMPETDAGTDAPPEPCPCGGAVSACVITTGGPFGDPAVWDACPVAVDGWQCARCERVTYPRFLSVDRSVELGRNGTAHLRRGEYVEAEWWFTRIVWSWPGYVAARLDLATALRARLEGASDPALRATLRRRAREALEVATELPRGGNPTELVAHAYLGLAELAIEDRAQEPARRAVHACLGLEGVSEATRAHARRLADEADAEAWIFREALDAVRPFFALQDVEPRRIETAAQRGAVTRAVEVLEAYASEHAGHWQSLFGAAMGRAALGQADASLALWRAAAAAHPFEPNIAREASKALLEAGQNEEARLVMRTVLHRVPSDATLWCNLAVCELLCGDRAEAERTVTEALRLAPEDAISRALSLRLVALASAPLPRTLAELERRSR